MLEPRLNLSDPQPGESCECPAGQSAERMASNAVALEIAYEMAYGLSHELNNPLANIAGRARLLAENEPDPVKRQQLAVIVDQAMRGCEMIADLMLFARPPAWRPTRVQLPTLLSELCQRALSTNSGSVKIDLDIDPSMASACIEADQQALAEALWAILRNALDVARSSIHVRLVPMQQRTELIIADDGPGLSDKALSHAFHPFFSGREAGRGIGLGLSKAQRIIALCGGTIRIENAQGGGCRVTIELS